MTAANLSIDERRDPGRLVLTLAGELDIATVPRLRSAVQSSGGEGAERVVLDFAGVTFCDSQGLSTLIALRNGMSEAGRELVLTNVSDFMNRLLDVTGLRALFAIETAGEAAGTRTGE